MGRGEPLEPRTKAATLLTLITPRTSSRQLRPGGLKADAIPRAEKLLFRLPPAWGLALEICVYTFKRIESHTIIHVTKSSAISNINEDK